MTFDLRQHIRTILAETTEENLNTLTELIFDRTPMKATREAYRQSLAETVRKELASAPRAPRISRLDQSTPDTQTRSVEPGQNTATGEDQSTADAQRTVVLPGGGQNHRTSRPALARLVLALRRKGFRSSIWIGDSTYPPLLECTVEQLEFAAGESHKQADQNRAVAHRYELLAKLMREHDAETVADLPVEAIEELADDE